MAIFLKFEHSFFPPSIINKNKKIGYANASDNLIFFIVYKIRPELSKNLREVTKISKNAWKQPI